MILWPETCRNQLAFVALYLHRRDMGLTINPVTLSVEQIAELSKMLSNLRHNINNHLALIVAATELIKFNSEMAERMSTTLMEQPPKISEEINKFSKEFDRMLGITRP
jgi:uncharacterized coiled-coil DUF342 family protein